MTSSSARPNRLRALLGAGSGSSSLGLLVAIVLLLVAFSAAAPGFATTGNLFDTLRDVAVIGIMAVGMTLVITGGGIDLSVGSVVLVSGIVTDQLSRVHGAPAFIAILGGLGVGLLVGSINAVAVTMLRIPPFIATLATLYIFQGIGTQLYQPSGADGSPLLIEDLNLVVLGQGYLLGLPLPGWLLVATIVAAVLALRSTSAGAHLRAVGSDPWIARMTSLPINRTLAMTYIVSGLLAALAGVLVAARLQTGAPEAGRGVEFDVIAAAVLGGASLLGGRGSVPGAVLGAVLVTVISKGLTLLGVSANYQALIQGALIVLAVAIDALRVRSVERRRLRNARRDDDAAEHSGSAGASFEAFVRRAPRTSEAGPVLLRAENVSKRYGQVQALAGVSIELRAGEVHALVGENGAGKSTMIKILSGAVASDTGSLSGPDGPVVYRSPMDALTDGIAVIYQDRTVVPGLSVAENVLLGREPRAWGPFLHRAAMRRTTTEALRRLAFDVSPDRSAGGFSPAHQQLIDIARVVASDAKVVIFDEPTASLSRAETKLLFGIIDEMRAAGKAVVFIGHSIPEIFEIADRVTVLRDGRSVQTSPAAELDHDELIRLMVGRDVELVRTAALAERGAEVLEVDELNALPVVRSATLRVAAGEIVGIYGLVGSGRTSLLQALSGTVPITGGRIAVDGRTVRIRSPRSSIAAGLAYVAEDRKGVGIVGSMSIAANLTLAHLRRVSFLSFWMRRAEEQELAQALAHRMGVVPADVSLDAGRLSGGNQQKVSIGRWLSGSPRVLLLDEPTQGVDVGAREEIYAQLRALARTGVAVLFVTSYLPEVLQLSHRILVMRSGRIVHEALPEQSSEESLLQVAAGANNNLEVAR